jgi:hypothetical protein
MANKPKKKFYDDKNIISTSGCDGTCLYFSTLETEAGGS